MIEIRFWGVRGSRPNPSKEMVKYGGNTSCMSIQIGSRMFIFDGGTGIINLGKYILENDISDCHIFFSHMHWDHIQGIPFFPVIYSEKPIGINMYGEDKEKKKFEDLIKAQMTAPYFPVALSSMDYKIKYHSIDECEISFDDGVIVSSCRLNHPNGCFAYKLCCGGKSVVYAIDTEKLKGKRRECFVDFAGGADLLLYDAQYTKDEYFGTSGKNPKKGFGHSTFEDALAIYEDLKPETMYLWHHDDWRTDKELDSIIEEIQKKYKSIFMAQEGCVISFG